MLSHKMKTFPKYILILLSTFAGIAQSCNEAPKKNIPVERVNLEEVAPIVNNQQSVTVSGELDWKVVDEFYEAIDSNDTEKVKEMLATKIPANYQFKGKVTPLHALILFGGDNLELAKLLVKSGFTTSGKENSDVLYACEYKRLKILKYLILETGASKDNGAFNKAGFYQFYEGAKFLLLQGAKQLDGDIRGKLWVYHEAVKKSDYEVLNLLQLNADELNHNDCEGQTALIISIKNNNKAMVEYLLKKGIKKDKPETFDCGDDIYYGEKPIEIAKKNGATQIVELLN